MTEKPFLGKRYSRVSSVHDYLLEPVRTEARQRIMKEILEKAQKHEVSCLCGNPDKDVPLAQMDRWGLPCTTVLCSHCGMIRVNPRFGGNVYGEIYAELYWPMAMGLYENGFLFFILADYQLAKIFLYSWSLSPTIRCAKLMGQVLCRAHRQQYKIDLFPGRAIFLDSMRDQFKSEDLSLFPQTMDFFRFTPEG